MNELLPASLRARMGGSKWLPLHAKADVGVGARNSRTIGPGIEFAQYRDYETGDDLRYLDKHVYARLGRTVIRQFTVEQQLRVSVLLDRSASMGIDDRKWHLAQQAASICGFLTLNGSDRATMATFREDELKWGRPFSRFPSLENEMNRLGDLQPEGQTKDLSEIARRSLEHLMGRGLLVVVSDWMMDGVEEALNMWRAKGQEILAIQVLGPQDVDPSDDLQGWSRLVDVETHERVERYIDARALGEYRDLFRSWQDQVQEAVWKAEGRWISVRADQDDAQHILGTFRRNGLIT